MGTRARRLRVWFRAWHVEYLDAKIDAMRVPYGGQPIETHDARPYAAESKEKIDALG